ncbi:MAG: heavy metal-associated domain-containing protein [Sphaerochaeta sp.]|uniref:heavy-metal-associated domain-containing protein n=1 Tax=unclassified Sphaerochaeta TaxID=2637943 RepID=UPI000AC84CD7|nr:MULTISPECIES: heavy metal-associated domain-containing protein [unclassified Sphaerochaeta]MCK9602074.1 heavy-metal-associated domain-containing protein [Sphaerochaeta sp.]MDX9825749.1 heavy metal-associated domain-containing protein [Sphaerochaeta sp.]MEA4865044.1 heavy metal-associated domain-containing protein [Sphaerochaeta sp.]HPE94350.1 heavy metal-associated domain-containing protein [Sphaerochaeta sp.]
MKTVIMTEGMHCNGCETRMVNALTQIEDIKDAKADAKSGKVVIKHANKETIDEAKRLIAEIGFEVKA